VNSDRLSLRSSLRALRELWLSTDNGSRRAFADPEARAVAAGLVAVRA
jgi:hypothetical protein